MDVSDADDTDLSSEDDAIMLNRDKVQSTLAGDIITTLSEVRALLWRETWMRNQLELLARQRESLMLALERSMAGKTRITDSQRRYVSEAISQRDDSHSYSGIKSETKDAEPSVSPDIACSDTSETAAHHHSMVDLDTCARCVPWGDIPRRRFRLVRAYAPGAGPPPLETSILVPSANVSLLSVNSSFLASRPMSGSLVESKKRRRAAENNLLISGSRNSLLYGKAGAGWRGSLRFSSVAATAENGGQFADADGPGDCNVVSAADRSDRVVAGSMGSVVNGGRKMLLSSGQRITIKFSAGSADTPGGSTSSTATGYHSSSGLVRAANRVPPFHSSFRRPGVPTPNPLLKRARGRRAWGAGRPPGSLSSGQWGSSTRVSGSGLVGGGGGRGGGGGGAGGADWGIDDYVYGGPRTQTVIELVRPKDIETPGWHRIGDRRSFGSRRQRKLAVAVTETAPVISSVPAAAPLEDAGAPNSARMLDKDCDVEVRVDAATRPPCSSSENTDDDVYQVRHRPYEEQEIRFRFPKQLERERKHREALRREGGSAGGALGDGDDPGCRAEVLYKSLWYTSRQDNAPASAGSSTPILSGRRASPGGGGSGGKSPLGTPTGTSTSGKWARFWELGGGNGRADGSESTGPLPNGCPSHRPVGHEQEEDGGGGRVLCSGGVNGVADSDGALSGALDLEGMVGWMGDEEVACDGGGDRWLGDEEDSVAAVGVAILGKGVGEDGWDTSLAPHASDQPARPDQALDLDIGDGLPATGPKGAAPVMALAPAVPGSPPPSLMTADCCADAERVEAGGALPAPETGGLG